MKVSRFKLRKRTDAVGAVPGPASVATVSITPLPLVDLVGCDDDEEDSARGAVGSGRAPVVAARASPCVDSDDDVPVRSTVAVPAAPRGSTSQWVTVDLAGSESLDADDVQGSAASGSVRVPTTGSASGIVATVPRKVRQTVSGQFPVGGAAAKKARTDFRI